MNLQLSSVFRRPPFHGQGIAALTACVVALVAGTASADDWRELFDGVSLQGWKAAENPQTWRVEDDCLVADGPRSHLFYVGNAGNHDFQNFELIAEYRTQVGCNSGVFFHTAFQESGWPKRGYEVQINDTYVAKGDYRELKRTGSLYGVRNVYDRFAGDGVWNKLRIKVAGRRIRVWVNDVPTVDYVEPDDAPRAESRSKRILSRGTVALQAHDPDSRIAFRRVAIRMISDKSSDEATTDPRVSGYGVSSEQMDRLASQNIPVIDYHVHLRGGMTVDKAVHRRCATGVNVGVLRNLGAGWPIETDEQLKSFLDSIGSKPVFVGLQVNDRDWMDRHSPQLLKRLDFVLADTMIMPMPTEDSPPVKLWMPEGYDIKDPDAWMERYMLHNLKVLSEPVTILANPTYLPPPVEHLYDALWTDERMRTIIDAAIENEVALEINASSGLPSDRFIRLAKSMGAKFSFGTNNFDDQPIDMGRFVEAIEKFGLTKNDMYVADQPGDH
ncbi:DUF1080 domain-containing protein [Crateriforma conspicua]|uniref:3-keto-alpha-glucoside-1,2-lyase/3-keto-2-hydroxy-glucal hydratase domain-containing protein n=1 Tax=Crateriforma conspicua TaxID=2527996 RepID=A0A5C5Y9G2_9PLAN|nr:family 16 glycoside hydrolase [Crateriforma conspicua]TWT72326.1 hypothetical protein Pan14r_46460 [Crateriforma conspicua]